MGESEANIREVFEVARASAPCVLRIDEIDKGFGGDSHDGGTTSRVNASLLTWLEEKPDTVFVVATANNLNKLQRMPELISRFSDVFFVDLPNLQARADILKIHLAPKHSLPDGELLEVAANLRGYSGRELRNTVRTALALSFKAGLQHPRK